MLPQVVAALILSLPSAHATRVGARVACDTIHPTRSDGAGLVVMVSPGDGGRVAWTDGEVMGRGAPPPLLFARDGRGAVHAVGRAGAGPGEFRSIGALSWRGDTLWVSDVSQRRIQAFDASGQFMSSLRVDRPSALIMSPGGTVVGVQVLSNPAPGTGVDVTAIPMAVLATQGSGRSDTLLRIPPAIRWTGDPYIISELMQGPHTRSDAVGGNWCTIARAETRGLAVSCADAAGKPFLHGIQMLTPRATTDTIWGGAVAGMVKRTRGKESYKDITDFFHRPAFLPLGFDILVNRNGDLWILRTHASEPKQVWDRFRRDGTALASLTVAGRVQIRALDGGWYYAADTDADDLQTLIRCKIP